jgi:phosphosulfolactate synthase
LNTIINLLKDIPIRTDKPRANGLTMIMDKGLSYTDAESLVENAADYIDYIKFGFGTALVSKNIKQKIELYKKHHIKVYLGGTLFEAFLIRNQLKEFENILSDLDIDIIEISDGSIQISHQEKCSYIQSFSKKYTVLSEVGSKDVATIIPPFKWIELMQEELLAGSTYVIAEARESGNVGIYRGSGEVREGLVQEILTQIPSEKIIWEAPQKAQQVYFLNLLGANVNLGNIAPSEIIALEATRLGLRGDTFFYYLNK